MTMSGDIHGNGMNMTNTQKISNKQHDSNINNVMLHSSQDCPLCFHPNVLNDWASYRDAFVSLTTRNFTCPICHSCIQGVDKFTLHLVSHDLRAKVWRPSSSTSLESNIVVKNGEVPCVPHSVDIHQCQNVSNHQNSVVKNDLIFQSTNKQSIISGINQFNQEANKIIHSSNQNSNFDNISNTTFQDLIKEEDNSDPNASPCMNITEEIFDEHTGSSRYLDELLNDYSDFVQQQEKRKEQTFNHGIADVSKINPMPNNGQPSIDIEKTKPFLALGNNLNLQPSQSHLNESTPTTLSTNISYPPNMFSLPNPLHNNSHMMPNGIASINNNINNTNANIAAPNTSKTEKQVTINVQVPKPLYHKYFSSNSRLDTEQVVKNFASHEKEKNEIMESQDIFQEGNLSNEYKSCNSHSTLIKTDFSPNSKDLLHSKNDDANFKKRANNNISATNAIEERLSNIPYSNATYNPMIDSSISSVGSDSSKSIGTSEYQKTEVSSPSQAAVQCSLCGWNFDNEKFLQLHTVLMHSPHRKRGNIAGKAARGGKPKSFGKRQALESFQCRECNGVTFKHHEEYTKHLKLVHNDNRYVCHICGKMFKLRGSLLVHVRVVHNPMIEENEDDFYCRTCNRKFSSRHRRDLHEKKHCESKTTLLESNKTGLGQSIDVSNKPLPISLGGIPSLSPSVSESEQAQKHDPNKLIMQYSNHSQGTDDSHNTVTQNTGLASKTIDSQSNSINAETTIVKSNSSVTRQNQSNTHNEHLRLLISKSPKQIENNQNNDSMFQCHLCEKKFKRQTHLQQHLLTHEPRQWDCDVCKKTFTTKYFLKKHKRLHTGETPYSCNICGKSFTFQQSYHKHMLYHTDEKPYACSKCGRAFKELSTLQNHERIHSGERPFACETCGKSFRQRVSYLVHRRIHTGVMPYTCDLCGKNFRYKVTQRTHKCVAKSQDNSPQQFNDAGIDQKEEKTSLPSLPKQIQDDLHKFRKAQSRRMLHDRLHSYINHLHDNDKLPNAMLPPTQGKLDTEIPKKISMNLAGMQSSIKANDAMPGSGTVPIPSALTTGYLHQQNFQQTSPSVNLSGKSSPIGRQLQQLSISENSISQHSRLSNHDNSLNNVNFHDQESANELLNAENNTTLPVSSIFDTLTEPNSDQMQSSIHNQQTSNMTNENSDAIEYNLF